MITRLINICHSRLLLVFTNISKFITYTLKIDSQTPMPNIIISRIKEGFDPLIDVTLDGYDFVQTPTKTRCGGTGFYIRNGYEYEVLKEFSKSEENICESIFIELKRHNKNNLIVGCIYRHHTSPELFIDNFLKKTVDNISKKQNKLCTIMGDFNIDLLKYDSVNSSSDFYDLLSSYGYRPLIMQPTRVTSHSATLIDNIFINDLETQSTGGNITASISDHFSQFSQINIFDKPIKTKKCQIW